MSTFSNSEDPDVYTVYKGNKDFHKNTNFLKIYNRTSIDMYNGLSQVYCIKPEGKFASIRIQWVKTDG